MECGSESERTHLSTSGVRFGEFMSSISARSRGTSSCIGLMSVRYSEFDPDHLYSIAGDLTSWNWSATLQFYLAHVNAMAFALAIVGNVPQPYESRAVAGSSRISAESTVLWVVTVVHSFQKTRPGLHWQEKNHISPSQLGNTSTTSVQGVVTP
jgi:hypothetical protein